MISILIPVYNIEAVSLVNELSRQLNSLNLEGEIVVFDDCSSCYYRELNKPIHNLNRVRYTELDRNHGRAAIRKLLASEAKFEWLLFLDSDSRIILSDFLKKYVAIIKNDLDVCAGGRIYPSRPAECSKRLHWKYGAKRESVKGSQKALHSNNFFIKKEIFQQLNFPVFLKQYGYEDVWMGIELERCGKRILHINNPVEHTQIEETKIFLTKTQYALQNLLLLSKAFNRKVINRHVSLFKVYSRVRQLRLEFAVHFFYHFFKRKIYRNLNSCDPSLFFFDLYRLHHLLQLSRNTD